MTTGQHLLAAGFVALAVLLWPRPARRTADGVDRSGHRPHWWGIARRHRTTTPYQATQAPTVTDVAGACDLLALALSSGAAIETALAAVAGRGDDRIAHALRALAAGRAWGLSPIAWGDLVHPGWTPLLTALRLADNAGIPPSGPLRRAAADLRSGQRARREVATARLRVLVVLPLGLCFLPAFVLTTVVPVVLVLISQMTGP